MVYCFNIIFSRNGQTKSKFIAYTCVRAFCISFFGIEANYKPSTQQEVCYLNFIIIYSISTVSNIRSAEVAK